MWPNISVETNRKCKCKQLEWMPLKAQHLPAHLHRHQAFFYSWTSCYWVTLSTVEGWMLSYWQCKVTANRKPQSGCSCCSLVSDPSFSWQSSTPWAPSSVSQPLNYIVLSNLYLMLSSFPGCQGTMKVLCQSSPPWTQDRAAKHSIRPGTSDNCALFKRWLLMPLQVLLYSRKCLTLFTWETASCLVLHCSTEDWPASFCCQFLS